MGIAFIETSAKTGENVAQVKKLLLWFYFLGFLDDG
jgi:hypothetical protein